MESILIVLVSLNLGLTLFFIFRSELIRKSIHSLNVKYFHEVSDVSGFIKKQKKIQIKAQFYIGEIPIGQPFLMSEQITEDINEERIKKIIDDIAKPLSTIGVKAIKKQFIG